MQIVFTPTHGISLKKDASGDQPPSGFTPVPQSKRGAYHQKDGDHWVYWIPGEGIQSSPGEEESGESSSAQEDPNPRNPAFDDPGTTNKAVDDALNSEGQKKMAEVMKGVQGDPNSPGYQAGVEQEVMARNSTGFQEWRNHKLAFLSIVSAVSKVGQGAAWLGAGGQSNPLSDRLKSWSDKAMADLSPEEKVVGASYAADYAWWGLPVAAGAATGSAAVSMLSYGSIFKALVGGAIGLAGLTGLSVGAAAGISMSVASIAGYSWYAGFGKAFYNNVIKRAAHTIGQKVFNGELDMDMLEKMHGTQYGEEYTPEQSSRMYTKAILCILLDLHKADGFDLLKAVQDAEDPIGNDPQMQQMLAKMIAELHTGAFQDTLAQLEKGEVEFDEDQTAYIKIIARQMEKAGLTEEGSTDVSDDAWSAFFQNPFSAGENSEESKDEADSEEETPKEETSGEETPEEGEEPLEGNFPEKDPEDGKKQQQWPNSQEPQPFTRSLSFSPFYTP